MKNGKHGVIAQIAGPGLVLAALLGTVSSNPGIGRAQAGTASPAVTPENPTEAPAKKPVQPAGQSPAKGQHEGIKVHGHWTIEVRNPDGRLVSHTEFENALVQPNGAQLMAGMLAGNLVPGGYRIDLASDPVKTIGPCASINTSQSTSCKLVGSLISPEPAAFGDGSSGCGGTYFTNPITAAGPCFPLNIGMNNGTGLAFNGTAVASTSSPITDVFLDPILCIQASETTVPNAEATISPNSCAQSDPTGGTIGALTHATLPAPVQVSGAGQLIFVTMQLSFQ
jgi:hypothetical protein